MSMNGSLYPQENAEVKATQFSEDGGRDAFTTLRVDDGEGTTITLFLYCGLTGKLKEALRDLCDACGMDIKGKTVCPRCLKDTRESYAREARVERLFETAQEFTEDGWTEREIKEEEVEPDTREQDIPSVSERNPSMGK